VINGGDMKYALLISQDTRLISEFEKIAAVTQTELVVSVEITEERLANAYRVFIDAVHSDLDIHHSETVIVTHGAVGPDTWRMAMRLGAIYVALMPESRDWVVEHMVAPTSSEGVAVAFIPAVGGAGASYLSAAFSVANSRMGSSVTLVDADPRSIGLDIVCGGEEVKGSRWSDLAKLEGTVAGTDIRSALPTVDNVAVLSADSRGSVMSARNYLGVTDEVKRVSDLTVIDGAHASDSVTKSLIDVVDKCVLVVPSNVRACAAANQALNELPSEKVIVVVRQIPGSGLSSLTISDTLGVPVFTNIPTDQRIVEQVEQGFGLGNVNLGGFSRSIGQLTSQLMDEDLRVAVA